jgi:hypothetical protein
MAGNKDRCLTAKQAKPVTGGKREKDSDHKPVFGALPLR